MTFAFPQGRTRLQLKAGHSLDADARFIDAAAGDYGVKPDSPAIALGFVNFDMRSFGVAGTGAKNHRAHTGVAFCNKPQASDSRLVR